jgi:hypothetical protein
VLPATDNRGLPTAVDRPTRISVSIAPAPSLDAISTRTTRANLPKVARGRPFSTSSEQENRLWGGPWSLCVNMSSWARRPVPPTDHCA